ncbi:MAG: hypothetical protein KDJ52_00295 [Anaerolineae bacterium]|nr:hypothetical protein [Anaerolineae bacterium]
MAEKKERIELSSNQRDPLFALVKYQQQQGHDVVFAYVNGEISPKDQINHAITTADDTLVGLWSEDEYIYIHHYPAQEFDRIIMSATVLLRLKANALEYYAWLQKPSWQRWLIKEKESWGSPSKNALVSGVISVVSAVLTVLLLKMLGLS